jgi:hypothetical protein
MNEAVISKLRQTVPRVTSWQEVAMPVAIELSPQEQEQYRHSHRWSAAIKSGLIAGAIIWLFPAGNPWTAFMRSGAHIMGRPVSLDPSVTMFTAHAIPAHVGHFIVSIVYAALILAVVYRLHAGKALLAGVITGAVLYGINFAVFRMAAPQFTGPYEVNVALAHVLFGGIAAGCIRGFLRPPQKLDETQPNPGPQYSKTNP